MTDDAKPTTVKKEPDSTTQQAITLTLTLARRIADDDAATKAGLDQWQTGLATGHAGKTLAIAGLSRIGVHGGKIMHTAFGMRVILEVRI